MTVDERIESAVERVRSIWAVCMSAAIVWVLFTQPLWWLLPLIGIGVVTYFGSLYVTGVFLAMIIPRDELQAAIAQSELLERDAISSTGLEVGEIAETSEPIGRYMDLPIFEWVDILEERGKVRRYVFEHVTPKDQVGNLLLSNKIGFAHYSGCTYKAST